MKIHHHGESRLSDLAFTALRHDCYREIVKRHFDFLSGLPQFADKTIRFTSAREILRTAGDVGQTRFSTGFLRTIDQTKPVFLFPRTSVRGK